ncbi:MAG: hypothetical protein JJE13_08425 [Thermoleophilia bacterium]|nr:hypothetical protein [Thermoleophilia bacterium]
MTAVEREKVVEQQGGRTEEVGYEPPPAPPEPGRIEEGGCGSSRIPMTHTNVWSAAGVKGKYYLATIVCAGAYRKNPNTGYFLIVRNRLPSATTRFHRALVPRSGPVRITWAPLGDKGSARVWDAHIKFESSLGTVGYLDLADDSLHITGGPVEGDCPAGTTGMPPNCVIDKAKLGYLKVTPENRVLKRGKKAVFTVRIENIGRAATRRVNICVKASKKLVKVRKWCRATGKLRAGESARRKFRVRVKRKARQGRKVTLRFKATAGVAAKSARATIKVR